MTSIQFARLILDAAATKATKYSRRGGSERALQVFRIFYGNVMNFRVSKKPKIHVQLFLENPSVLRALISFKRDIL